MRVLLYTVGQMISPQVLPTEEGWYEPFVAEYNKRANEKVEAKELRRRIAAKLSYIRRQGRKKKSPWYK